MLERLVVRVVRRYVGGPAGSWVYAALAVLGVRAVRSKVGRAKIVERRKLKPGHRVVIEHLDVSHDKQMKQFKAERKAQRRAVRAARKRPATPTN